VIKLIIGGGQDGGDLAGWRAAGDVGIATGGCMPKGWRTESGPHPEYAARFGAHEHPSSAAYPPRTEENVRAAGVTLILNAGEARSPGTKLAADLCRRLGRPYTVVDPGSPDRPPPLTIAGWLASYRPTVVNVAGNRAPEPWEDARAYLREAFALLVLNGEAAGRKAPALLETLWAMNERLDRLPESLP
jgi:hypothetical protein